MVIDKNYFLTRLANGEDIATIGNEVAAMMNAAMEEHKAAEAAKKAEAEKQAKAAAKRDQKIALAAELIDVVRDLAALEGLSTEFLEDADEKDMLDLADAMIATVQTVAALEQALTLKPATKSKKVEKTDEQILADFLATLF